MSRLRGRINDRLKLTSIESNCEFPVPVPKRTVAGITCEQLLQVTNEVLNNVVKHSASRKFNTTLMLDGKLLSLVFADDGCGFDPAQLSSERRGLNHLSTRAESIGGSVKIFSQPGAGTRVRVELPILPPGLDLASPNDGDSPRQKFGILSRRP